MGFTIEHTYLIKSCETAEIMVLHACTWNVIGPKLWYRNWPKCSFVAADYIQCFDASRLRTHGNLSAILPRSVFSVVM